MKGTHLFFALMCFYPGIHRQFSEAFPINGTEPNSTITRDVSAFPRVSLPVAVVASSTAKPASSPRSPLERVEVDSYLKNKRALQLQIKCVIYDGPCDIVGREVKKYIVHGLTGKCTNCSSRLKGSIEKVASHIQENYPQAWYDAIYKYLVIPSLGIPVNTTERNNTTTTIRPETI